MFNKNDEAIIDEAIIDEAILWIAYDFNNLMFLKSIQVLYFGLMKKIPMGKDKLKNINKPLKSRLKLGKLTCWKHKPFC